jgi:hypothetical protein
LLFFSETLRDDYAALQKKTAASAQSELESDGSDSAAKVSPRLNAALPSFFSSEATSSEAAKFHTSNDKKKKPAGSSSVSQSTKFLQSLSMLQSGGTDATAASLFPEMSSSLASNVNNNFSTLEERVPFSNDNTTSTTMFSLSDANLFYDGGDGSKSDNTHPPAVDERNSENETVHHSSSFRSDTAAAASDLHVDINDGCEEPAFFIGSGTDIE